MMTCYYASVNVLSGSVLVTYLVVVVIRLRFLGWFSSIELGNAKMIFMALYLMKLTFGRTKSQFNHQDDGQKLTRCS